eukprot:TRINITY_DN11487_c0_g3_i5.p1 TRINITY_DN11487_c0_g3~~TRINITY_DN11487_c0_g3_i5.p1  ORF type:complete len:203 (+),score=39.11 TRINITY_DN11487_c0_g3_i5:533-1141(+)
MWSGRSGNPSPDIILFFWRGDPWEKKIIQIFSSISGNVNQLDLRMSYLRDRDGEGNGSRENLLRKKSVFQYIRWCTILNLALGMIGIFKVMIPWEFHWTVALLSQLSSLVALGLICFFLKPFPGVFITHPSQVLPPVSVRFHDHDGVDHDGEVVEGIVIPWDLGKTILVEWPLGRGGTGEGGGDHGRTFLSIGFEEEYYLKQ